MSQKALRQEQNNTIKVVEPVIITEHLLELLLNFLVHLRVRAQQVESPIHSGGCSIMALQIRRVN